MSLFLIMSFIVITVIMALSFRTKNPEISSTLSVALCIYIIGLCVKRIELLIDSLEKISNFIKLDKAYIKILLKLIGVAYICEFGAGISKDAGYSAVASQIEMYGKLTMMIIALPVLLQIIEIILEM